MLMVFDLPVNVKCNTDKLTLVCFNVNYNTDGVSLVPVNVKI